MRCLSVLVAVVLDLLYQELQFTKHVIDCSRCQPFEFQPLALGQPAEIEMQLNLDFTSLVVEFHSVEN